jgi:hypothetical protein
VILLPIVACIGSASPTPITLPTFLPQTQPEAAAPAGETAVPASQAAAASTQPSSSSAFAVAVIVDGLSDPASRAQAQAVIDEASRLLLELTPFGIEMVDFVEDAGGGSTNDMVSRYVASHATALPSGIVVFSFGDNGQAKASGAYSYGVAAPVGFQNSFVSPVLGANHIYVAVVDFSQKYAPCGYGGSETAHSSTSLDGECHNQAGKACVQQNGRSICADAARTLYNSTPTYYLSSTIVHQLLHPFAPGGDQDHFSTPECNARMGYPPEFFDLQESQYYNDLCPFVYEYFAGPRQP